MILTFRAIDPMPHWGAAGAIRPSSPFDSTYSDTLQVLDRELEHLRARDAFLQVVASDHHVRLDGQLRADAKVDHPGVALTIDTPKHGTLVYETDRYKRASWKRNAGPSWQQNLRAIALGLEALRKVERYGIARRGEQYAGYRELGAGIALGAAMTLDEAAALLCPDDPDRLIEFPDEVGTYFRWLSKTAHPDAGGDPEAFRRLTEARDLLQAAAR